MAKFFKRTMIRPSVDVPWHTDVVPSAYDDEFDARYRSTGKFTELELVESEDGLSRSRTIIWSSQEDLDDFKAWRDSYTGPKVNVDARVEYENEHGIYRIWEEITE